MTNSEIIALRSRAFRENDLRFAMICDLAVYGPDSLRNSAPGSIAANLLAEGRDQVWARAQCAARAGAR